MQKEKQEIYDHFTSCVREELELFEHEYKKQLETEDVLLKPVLDYIVQKRGKRIRPIVFLLSQGLFQKPDPKDISLAVMVELLHTASLIHDDVVDRSKTRRGSKTVNTVWNNRVSVLVGDYLLAKVLHIGIGYPIKAVLKIISNVVLRMGEGELHHVLINAQDSFSVKEYFHIVRNKTAELFSASCELGGLAASASSLQRRQLKMLGETIGICFQLRDDILDLNGSFDRLGKPVGQDLMNGTVTLPVLSAMEEARRQKEDVRYSDIRSKLLKGDDRIREFVDQYQGIEKTQLEIQRLSEKASGIVKTFKPSVYREALKALIMYNMERAE